MSSMSRTWQMMGPATYRDWLAPFAMFWGKTVCGGCFRDMEISVARSRKSAVCLRAGIGVLARTVERNP